jgi:hypothetical protein
MKNHELLSSHSLMKYNSTFITPIIEKISPELIKEVEETGKPPRKRTTTLGFSEIYHLLVFQKATAIIDCMERLENSLIFIEELPKPRTYEKKGIHHFSWLDYHYSYFVVIFVSLYDTALILTNIIFRLGIPEHECKPNIIQENEWVKLTSVRKTLINLGRITSKFKGTRNFFVHRGEIPDISNVTGSEMLEFLKVYNNVRHEMRPIYSDEQFDQLIKAESKKIIIELGNDLVNAQKELSVLFNNLLPIYKAGGWF